MARCTVFTSASRGITPDSAVSTSVVSEVSSTSRSAVLTSCGSRRQVARKKTPMLVHRCSVVNLSAAEDLPRLWGGGPLALLT